MEVEKVKELYYTKSLTMKEVSLWCGVTMDSLVYFMRKHKIKRRTLKEASAVKFSQKPLSFKKKEILTPEEEKLKIAGTMLYWAEGTKSEKSFGIDFANSDPEMVRIFVKFLRTIFTLDEKRLRLHLYCYADQDISSLISFWCSITGVPASQLTKPYVRQDFRENGRKMLHGLIHIRYNDKKLLWEMKKMIEEYRSKFASVV